MADPPWWKSAVAYQIYPRSFADANGDGVGDLEGIRRRLAHVADLGVDAIWLSPFYPSPMADFGYDVRDYCDVDPLFGTLDDFDALVAECHRRDLRIIVDWVPNHSSDQHPWFLDARSSRSSRRRDWYIWRDPQPDGGPPNNWTAAFTGESAWTLDEPSGQYYLHLFLREQPDLNWRNPEVVAAMHDTLRFWLDRGVDGFRIDVVHGLVKRADLADVVDPIRELVTAERFDVDATHELIRGFRQVLEEYDGDRMMVGEVYILSTAQVATFYGAGDLLHLAFNFPPLYTAWDAARWRHRIDRVVDEFDPRDAWPTWVLSNHDNPRHRTRYGSEARARAAAILLLTLRGTPFLYAGEELGLEDAIVPAERVVDPGGRDGCRAPIPWTAVAPHGWDGADPWLPWPPQPAARSAEAQHADAGSVLHLYRRILAARRASPGLRLGSWSPVPTPDGVLGYVRRREDDHRVVLVNFVGEEREIPGVTGVVEVTSDGYGEGTAFTGRLGPDQAVIIRPT